MHRPDPDPSTRNFVRKKKKKLKKNEQKKELVLRGTRDVSLNTNCKIYS